MRIMKINKESQDLFFADLGRQLAQPAVVYVFGGTSLICLAMPGRLTDDVDAYSATDTVLKATLQTMAERYAWKVDDLDVSEISETPSQLAKPPVLYRVFDRLTVMVVDPNLTAVGKLDRAGADDIADLKWMLAEGHLDCELIERLITGAKSMDDKAKSIKSFNQITGRAMPLPQPYTPPPPKRRRWWWPL